MATDDTPFTINADLLFGHIQLHTREWREGDDLVFGGFSTTHDRYGRETSRTKCEENCRLAGYFAPESWTLPPAIEWPTVAWICAAVAFIAWLYH